VSDESLAPLLLDAPHLPDDLVFFEGAWTGRDELVRAASGLADSLAEVGVQPGAVVASLVPTSPAAVAAMFGVWAAGGALLPLNVRSTPAERAKATGRSTRSR